MKFFASRHHLGIRFGHSLYVQVVRIMPHVGFFNLWATDYLGRKYRAFSLGRIEFGVIYS